jgi:ribosomal protein S18 acetylase RimI-like enzyme
MKQLDHIKQISVEGYEFANQAVQNQNYTIYLDSVDSLIIRVWNESLDVIYAITYKEDDEYLFRLKQCINSMQSNKECCVNVYGENHKSVLLIKELGISLDQHGYQMECHQAQNIIDPYDLVIEPYSPRYIEQVARLYDEAYQISVYQQMGLSFNQDLVQKSKQGEAFVAFLSGEVVASYILDRNYIAECVVSPSFHGQGIGTGLLDHAVKQVLTRFPKVLIRVRRDNIKALNVYHKYGFVIIGNYAEHTK